MKLGDPILKKLEQCLRTRSKLPTEDGIHVI